MKRQKHNLSNYKLATTDMGRLVPVQLQEVLPGDTMQMETSALIRVSPMLAPVMHPCTVRFHHWFVPTRLVWDGWEDFITGGPDGNNADTIPTIGAQALYQNSVLDYMGCPPVGNTGDAEVNILPLRAFNLIFNEFYRDQDISPERDDTNTACPWVSWRKDYFTAARPWAQKGNDIEIPIGEKANIYATNGLANSMQISNQNDVDNVLEVVNDGNVKTADMFVDLSTATGVTATQFREFFALQRFAEARARYGSRYTEYLQYMGVKPSDARLQRPEYLGGGKQNLQFSEVLTTADTNQDPAGTMKGHGITALKTRKNKKFFEEHGYMITVMSVVPNT